jgi:hypothetical protein
MKLTKSFTRIAMPGGNCPNPNCGIKLGDWHVEWLLPGEKFEVENGRAATDCPICDAWVMFPEGKVGGLAPDDPDVKRFKRKKSQRDLWLTKAQVTPMTWDFYVQTTGGIPFARYDFQ